MTDKKALLKEVTRNTFHLPMFWFSTVAPPNMLEHAPHRRDVPARDVLVEGSRLLEHVHRRQGVDCAVGSGLKLVARISVQVAPPRLQSQ